MDGDGLMTIGVARNDQALARQHREACVHLTRPQVEYPQILSAG